MEAWETTWMRSQYPRISHAGRGITRMKMTKKKSVWTRARGYSAT
jgi:hypothetical protein